MFRGTPSRSTRTRAVIGLVAAGGLLVALAPGTAQALPSAGGAQAERLAPPPVATRTVTATVHFESGKSYLSSYSQRILVRLLRSVPAGAVVQSTKVIGYVQAKTAWDNGRALGTARAVEVRTHLRALGLGGRIDIASGGIFGNTDLSRRAVVTITYREKPGQIVWFTQPEDMTVGDDDQPLYAESTSGLRVTVRSTTTSVCTVVGTADRPVVHAVAVGTCRLVATQPGNAVYGAAASVSRTLSVDPQHISPPAPASYDVTYSAQQGTVEPTGATWTEGDDALVLPTPTRDGFTFDGWFTAATEGTLVGDAGDDFTPDADVTLYAHWTAVIVGHTVTFHANYADGPASTTQQSDEAAALTANPFTGPEGLTFAGWATEAGGAVVYADGAQYDFAADEDLYAVWGYSVLVTGMGMGERDVAYCGRADGHCGTEVAHASLNGGFLQIVVFPNQDAGGVLNGYEVVTTTEWGVDDCGPIYVEDTESPFYFGAGTLHFDVRGTGHIHLDMG